MAKEFRYLKKNAPHGAAPRHFSSAALILRDEVRLQFETPFVLSVDAKRRSRRTSTGRFDFASFGRYAQREQIFALELTE
jgi:hypothetical protein